MDIEKAKEVIENYFTHYINENPELALAVSIVLTELKKKDKVINEMAEYIIDLIKYNNPEKERDKEEIIEYFTNKVEREGK